MTRGAGPAERKLLIVGDAALFERVVQLELLDCALFLAENLSDAKAALTAHDELELALVQPGPRGQWLDGLLAVRPRLQVVLLTADQALARELAAVPGLLQGSGAVRAILAADAAPAVLRGAIAAAFEHIARIRAQQARARAPAPIEVREALTPWLHGSSGDAIQLGDDWLSVIAHDLRTPLGISNSYAALLLEEEFALPSDVRDIVQRVRSNGEWMLELVDGMLDFAQPRDRQPPLKFEPTTLAELVGAVARRMEGIAAPRRIHLDISVPKGATRYAVDRVRVEQVLHNLVSNAVKFSEPGSTVQVSARALRNKLTFQVHDAGPGMTREEAAQAFTKFSAQATGRGLGLAICKAIVELHGGHIWVESRPGVGSTFAFTIVPAGRKGARTRAATAPRAATRIRK